MEIEAYILVLNVLCSPYIYTWMQTRDTAEVKLLQLSPQVGIFIQISKRTNQIFDYNR